MGWHRLGWWVDEPRKIFPSFFAQEMPRSPDSWRGLSELFKDEITLEKTSGWMFLFCFVLFYFHSFPWVRIFHIIYHNCPY